MAYVVLKLRNREEFLLQQSRIKQKKQSANANYNTQHVS
uniref:Transposase n=1 Tax=Heterorhabditis bacteriophora TaxID=37862 RepID=A0A1I7WGL4_HETBA